LFRSLLPKPFTPSTFNSANFRWRDSYFIQLVSYRKDLNNPPTAVGGISDFYAKRCQIRIPPTEVGEIPIF
jgi:hypothetical protein